MDEEKDEILNQMNFMENSLELLKQENVELLA